MSEHEPPSSSELRRIHVVAVALGGLVGALLRWGQVTALAPGQAELHGFPLGTFLVNVLGSVVLTAFLTAQQDAAGLSLSRRFVYAVGVCGAYTTFSAFALETLGLIERGRAGMAAVYVGASLCGGLLGAAVGALVARRLRTLGYTTLLTAVFAAPLALLIGTLLLLRPTSGASASALFGHAGVVAIGGAVGASARFLVGGWIKDRVQATRLRFFPWGTFTVNLIGCFLIGLYSAHQAGSAAWVGPLVVTGLLGGFTTFSALAFESYELLTEGRRGGALLNLLGSLGVGLLAVGLGRELGRWIG